MEHVLGQGRHLMPQQNLGAHKEKTAFSSTEETSRLQHKHKTGQYFLQPGLVRSSELRQTASGEQVGQPKSSAYAQKSWPGGGSYCDDELVKHMSNLPGFLQQAEKETSIQERALNFGVLEWKRLEKWKYTDRMLQKSSKKTSSSSNPICSTSAPPKMSSSVRNQSTSYDFHPTSCYSGKQPLPRGSLFTSPPRQPPEPHSSHLNLVKRRNASYYNEEESHMPGTSKGKEIYNHEFQAAQTSTRDRQQGHFDQRAQINNRSSEANEQNSKIWDSRKQRMLGNVVSSSMLGKHKFSPSPPNKIIEKSEMQSDDQVKFSNEHCSGEPQITVLPAPNRFSHSRSESCRFMDFRTSLDGQFLNEAGNRLSDFFFQEFNSRELCADSPHSCPRRSTATVPTERATEPRNSVTWKSIDLGSRMKKCPSLDSPISIMHEGKYSIKHKENARSLSSVEASNKSQVSIAEQPIARGRVSSPTRRFSFSLGRMSRSFNFKESGELAQLNSASGSVKSGKARPEVSIGMDSIERSKETASSRGRSSPLRRLLDPLLKYKGSESTAEIVRTQNKSSCSTTVRTASRSSQDRKPEATTCQALLQLTLKNGQPCFKLVVDNSDDMLAAAVKRFPTSGKGDPCIVIALYSVHEIRKKSTHWIAQGLKSKKCSLGYDVVGQMKISNFYHRNENTGEPGEIGARECVLYCTSPGEVDRQLLEFSSNREVAAIIVKNSAKEPDDGELCGENLLYEEIELQHASAVPFGMEENEQSSGIVVILPGGIHGMPIKGAPSSLISRWRFDGLCDCGGWDVGCKLRVLADNRTNLNSRKASISSTDIDQVDLYVQGGELKNKPVFSLEPLGNGLYSIKLDASLSLLEAFAICVAYVTCQRFPELMDMKSESDAEVIAETDTGSQERKTPAKLRKQFLAKNTSHPCPPLSPAGRI